MPKAPVAKRLKHRIGELVVLALLLLCIVIYFFPIYYDQLSLDDQTWIPLATYHKIESLKNSPELSQAAKEGNYPVFVIFDIDATQLIYYENVIKMEIGNCYIYYGRVLFLMLHQATPQDFFKSIYEHTVSEFYFGKLDNEGVLNRLNTHPIVIITPDCYAFDNYTSSRLSDFQTDSGVYLISSSEATRAPIFDALAGTSGTKNQTENFYTYITTWSYSDRILEFYKEKNGPVGCEVSYPLLLFSSNVTLSIRLYDASFNWGTLSFFVDQDLVGTYSYNGSGQIIWLSYNLLVKEKGVHPLLIKLESRDRAIMRLDLIVVEDPSRT